MVLLLQSSLVIKKPGSLKCKETFQKPGKQEKWKAEKETRIPSAKSTPKEAEIILAAVLVVIQISFPQNRLTQKIARWDWPHHTGAHQIELL